MNDLLVSFDGIAGVRSMSHNAALCMVNIGRLAQKYFPGKSFTTAALPVGQFEPFFRETGIRPNERFPKIKVFKRQIEWCAGRLAFAVLSQKYFGAIHAVKTDERGAPLIDALPNSISISHSGDYAACVLSRNDTIVAVDMELMNEFHDKKDFLKVGFPEEEFDVMMSLPLAEVYRLWTLKECFLKVIGMGFGEKLKNVRITNDCFIYNGHAFHDISREVLTVDNHIISIIFTGRKMLDELREVQR